MVSNVAIESDKQRQLAGGRSNSRSTTEAPPPRQREHQQPQIQTSTPAAGMDVKRVVVVYEPWVNGSDKNNKQQQQQEVLDRIRDLTLRDATTENVIATTGTMVTPTPPTITLSTALDEPVGVGVGAPSGAAQPNKASTTNGPKDAVAPNSRNGGGLLGVPKIDLAKERRPPMMQATFT